MPAVFLAGAGVVAGWLVVTGILALPFAEAVLFALGGLLVAVLLWCVARTRVLWARALLIGGLVGTAGSLVLVLLLVVS